MDETLAESGSTTCQLVQHRIHPQKEQRIRSQSVSMEFQPLGLPFARLQFLQARRETNSNLQYIQSPRERETGGQHFDHVSALKACSFSSAGNARPLKRIGAYCICNSW